MASIIDNLAGGAGHARRIARLAEWAGRALFPHFCLACRREGSLLCDQCFDIEDARSSGVFWCPGCGRETADGAACRRDSCRETAGGLDAAVSVWPYGRSVPRRLLQQWKYGMAGEAGECLLELAAGFLDRERGRLTALVSGAVLVPVPLHPFRLAERGFNQAEAIAAAVAVGLGGEVRPELLRRRFQWRKQATVEDEGQRRRNAAGTVAVRRRGGPVPDRVLLVDDVMTTGATLKECAAELKRNGCHWVGGFTILHG